MNIYVLRILAGQEMFLFTIMFRPALKHTKYVLKIHVPALQQLVHDADQHHLAPTLRMHTAIPLLPMHAIMTCKGKCYLFTLLRVNV
jgi:hypothetical protein